MNRVKGVKVMLLEIPGSLFPVLSPAAANGCGNVWQAQDGLRMKTWEGAAHIHGF